MKNLLECRCRMACWQLQQSRSEEFDLDRLSRESSSETKENKVEKKILQLLRNKRQV